MQVEGARTEGIREVKMLLASPSSRSGGVAKSQLGVVGQSFLPPVSEAGTREKHRDLVFRLTTTTTTTASLPPTPKRNHGPQELLQDLQGPPSPVRVRASVRCSSRPLSEACSSA